MLKNKFKTGSKNASNGLGIYLRSKIMTLHLKNRSVRKYGQKISIR